MTELSKIARKITWVLFANQSLASAGFMPRPPSIPLSVQSLVAVLPMQACLRLFIWWAAAFAASAWGYIMDRIGRRNGMVAGLMIGVIGNALVLWRFAMSSFFLFLIGMVLMGITNAAVVLGRFAAAEVNPPEKRGAAISNVVLGGTFGAILGPLLVDRWEILHARWAWMNWRAPISPRLFCLRSQLWSSLLGFARTRVTLGNKLLRRTLILQ